MTNLIKLTSLLLILNSCVAQRGLNPSFKSILKKYNLTLNKPVNFKETPVIDNPNIKYQYALKHDFLDFEVRFLVRDINKALDLPDDERSFSFFTNIVLNVSGYILPNIPKIKILPKDVVKNENNADWGAISSFMPNSQFSKGFNICSVYSFRKNDIGIVYVFYMIKDKEKEQKLLQQNGNILIFNGSHLKLGD